MLSCLQPWYQYTINSCLFEHIDISGTVIYVVNVPSLVVWGLNYSSIHNINTAANLIFYGRITWQMWPSVLELYNRLCQSKEGQKRLEITYYQLNLFSQRVTTLINNNCKSSRMLHGVMSHASHNLESNADLLATHTFILFE
jgi:hypothetical protein